MTRPGRRKLFILGALVLFATVLLVGSHALVRHLLDRRLQADVEALDRLEPGWRWEDIEAARPTIPEDENSARRIEAAVLLLPAGWFNNHHQVCRPNGGVTRKHWDLQQALGTLRPPVLLDVEQVALIRGEMSTAEPARDQARTLEHFPRGRLLHDSSQNRYPNWEPVRKLTDLLRYDALLLSHDGDVAGAMRSCRAALQVSRALADEPSDYGQLVRQACEAMALRMLERTLALGTATDDDLRKVAELLADMLRAEKAQPRLLLAVRGERARFHRHFTAIETGERKLFASGEHPPVARLFDFVAADTVKVPHIWLLEHFTELCALAQLPASARAEAFQEFETARNESLWSELSYPWPSNYIIQLSDAPLSCALVALAVERHRRARHEWPATLAELVPGLLDAVPSDCFDGQPLRYLRRDEGVVIYSVGLDGSDDLGVYDPAQRNKTGNDVVFRLWDVAQRRQPPPAPPQAAPPPPQ